MEKLLKKAFFIHISGIIFQNLPDYYIFSKIYPYYTVTLIDKMILTFDNI